MRQAKRHRVAVGGAIAVLAVTAPGCGKGKRSTEGLFNMEPSATTAAPAYPVVPNPDDEPVHVGSCVDDDTCKVNGHCTVQKDRCIVGGDRDCQGSVRCEENGQCTARNGECVVGGDADCKRSKGCERGLCAAEGDRCTATAETCRTYPGCKSFGLCTLQGGRCVAGSDADCRQARVCQTDKWCVNRLGVCARE